MVWLVVLTILKNMKVNGKDDIPYMKRKKMFETTNRCIIMYINMYVLKGLYIGFLTLDLKISENI